MRFPDVFLVTNLILSAIGFTAGFYVFKQRRWATALALLFFAVQLVHILTPTSQWSFTLGFGVNVSLGWFGEGEYGLNLYALAMLLWCAWQALGNRREQSGTEQSGTDHH